LYSDDEIKQDFCTNPNLRQSGAWNNKGKRLNPTSPTLGKSWRLPTKRVSYNFDMEMALGGFP
jgi:hypothetical protein